jgi:hypothetical protein
VKEYCTNLHPTAEGCGVMDIENQVATGVINWLRR